MTIEEIKEKIKTDEYGFLRENEHLGKNICLLTLGGSYAYGMNTDTSDLDIRGCLINTKKEILIGNFYEQFTNTETDTVIYSFNKIIELLKNCNPNVIEMLGCKPEHYLYVSNVGKALLDNREMFLSKRCVNSFGGYANQQLRRLQNAMARDSYPKEEKEKHILNTIRNMKYHLTEKYPSYEENTMKLYIDETKSSDFEKEIFMDMSLKHFALRDYRGIMAEMNTVINEYSKLNKRNTKKDSSHLAKHMAHLLRLYMMVIDILEKKQIITFREEDHDILMKTRNQGFLEIASDKVVEKFKKEEIQMRKNFESQDFKDDFEYEMRLNALEKDIEKMMTSIYHIKDEFWDILDEYERRFDYAKTHTDLPTEPDYSKIDDLKADIFYNIVIDSK